MCPSFVKVMVLRIISFRFLPPFGSRSRSQARSLDVVAVVVVVVPCSPSLVLFPFPRRWIPSPFWRGKGARRSVGQIALLGVKLFSASPRDWNVLPSSQSIHLFALRRRRLNLYPPCTYTRTEVALTSPRLGKRNTLSLFDNNVNSN